MSDDIGLQQAIYQSLQTNRAAKAPCRRQLAAVSGILPVSGTPSENRVRAARVNTLEREGITSMKFGCEDDGAKVQPRVPLPSGRLREWLALSSGGHGQAQNTQQNHLLLTSDDIFPDRQDRFSGSECIVLGQKEPQECGRSRMEVKTLLKSLTGTGKYSVFTIGFTTSPPNSMDSFLGLTVHYEFTGAIYISVDDYEVIYEQDALEPAVRTIKRHTIERPQQARSKRDGLEIRVPFCGSGIDVYVNDQLYFKDVSHSSLGSFSSGVYLVLMAAGGRFSARYLDVRATDICMGASSPNSAALSDKRLLPHMGEQIKTPSAFAQHRAPSKKGIPSVKRDLKSALRGEENSFTEMIEREIIDRSLNVQWNDVAGMKEAKSLLNEAVVLPFIVPELFTGFRAPWKGILLYGPPGTGKTMIAKAVATCAKTTFFNISSSTLLSRFLGESEKIVRALFDSARRHAPSTVFFDEIDAVMGRRGGGNEHEATRRVKAEILQQIDGVMGSSEQSKMITILATTNTPWDLDEAMRRRLEKRIYIPLPDDESRKEYLVHNLHELSTTSDVDIDELVALTRGYSGSDLNQICRDAAMMPMRRLIADRSPEEIAEMRKKGKIKLDSVCMRDFGTALSKILPSVGKDELVHYEQWKKEFGST